MNDTFRLPQDEFELVKTAMRMNGNIPNKKLIQEFYESGMNEIDNLRLGQVDELCFEDRLKRQDEARERSNAVRRRMAKWMGMLSGYTNKSMYEIEAMKRYMK